MPQKTFEIGLVMAGAVSAGAYTAGVIDYLLQALKEWETAKNNNSDKAPPHKVQLKVVAGSSAGGMTGAILAAMINEQFEAITCLPGRQPNAGEIAENKLYNAWVEQIDITSLLGDNDLKKKNSKVTSLLDSTVLDEIAQSAIQFKAPKALPPFIADQLHLYLAITNLHGVPYHTTFQGQSGKGHSISKHTDYYHFQLSNNKTDSDYIKWLNPEDDQHHNWDVLKNVALATGAFPGGLAPRVINRPFSDYTYRLWSIPQRPGKNVSASATDCFRMEQIKPNWPAHSQEDFNFLSVDGGVMDNEPTELARRELAGNDLYNPRSADEVSRSLIMVDPFPSEQKPPLERGEAVAEHDIIGVLMKLFGSLKSQSRFNPDELILATADDVYSRFLIAPTRYTGGNTIAKYPIASGFLNGFGGFISKMFRMHDFQLGRRNCQQFLRKYFALPVDEAKQNPVFANYSEEDFKRFSYQQNGKSYLPVIPLLGETKKEEFPLQWETLKLTSGELDTLRDEIKGRTKVVIGRLIEQYVKSGFSRRMAKSIAWMKRDNITDKLMKIIKDDLKEFGLR